MIETFLISWNEKDRIKETVKHYSQFGKVNLYDNYSDDGTPEIADKLGAFVQTFGKKGVLDDKEYLKIKNNVWKNSSADYVIVCDVDEILKVDVKILQREHKKGVTIFNTFGWNVFSKTFTRNWINVNTGVYDPNFSKKIIFSPKLQGINYVYGCHECRPQGDIRFSDTILPLFHFRNLDCDKLIQRHKEYRKRMSDFNKKLRLGYHYLTEETKKRKEWKDLLEKSEPFSPGIISRYIR